MKKSLIAAAVAAMMTLTAGIAMAAPVELDGSMSYRFRSDTNETSPDWDGSIYRFTLNAKTEVAPNLSVYARLATEGLSGGNYGGAKDFSDTDTTKSFLGQVDQYGFLYNNAGIAYKIGRQDVTVGATGLLYDSTGWLGNNLMSDGITVSGQSGVTSLKAIAVQDFAPGTLNDNKIYALAASYKATKDLTLGATLAQVNYANPATENQTNWAINSAYDMGKATLFGEYSKSNADVDNKAYDLGVSYKFDAKNTAYVINYKVEQNADLGADKTAYEDNGKGFYYGVDHKFTKDTTGSLFFRQRSVVTGTANDNTSFRATVAYTF